MIPTVLYAAAHGGFRESVPLGGGAAVSRQLMEEWNRTRPFPLELLDPSILGATAPRGEELVKFGERDYARFCHSFRKAVTGAVLARDPARTVLLANDISEGPDFRLLAERGYRVYTIWHVDVVAYVANIYARGWVRPETMVRWHQRIMNSPLRALVPSMAGLVFDQQRDCVRYSAGLILPSEEMRTVVEGCYPEVDPQRIHVLPWGTWAQDPDPSELRAEVARLREEYQLPANALSLVTLSRISPEKGQDRLLEALLAMEQQETLPSRPLYLFLCGAPAFMQGVRHLEKLRNLAEKLERVKVVFPGHVTGLRKQAVFALGDVYVFPSVHESYGLTLVEALHAGLPAICMDHHGAREVMRPEFGEIAKGPEGLRRAIEHLLADAQLRRTRAAAARAWALTQSFSTQASRLARILCGESD